MNDGLQSEAADGPTSGWRQRSVVEVVVVIVLVVVVVVNGCCSAAQCSVV